MADEETQVEEDTLWWTLDGLPDVPPSSASFDEPLEWPEALAWEDPPDGWPADWASGVTDVDTRTVEPAGDFAFPSVDDPSNLPDSDWAPPPAGPGDPDPGGEATELRQEALPESIWSYGGPERQVGAAATAVYAEPEGKASRRWPPRLDVRHGNAAMVALASFVSLVLLGMFLSVRARTNVPPDSSQTRTTTDQISADRPLNTVPVPITAPTTLAPPSTISLADLLPPTDDGQPAATGPTASAPGTAATATTAAPARSTTPTGSGGGGGTTQSTQPTTATTQAAPEPEPEPEPAPTTPTTQDTTATTSPRPSVPTTQFTIPTITMPPFTVPSFPRPSDRNN